MSTEMVFREDTIPTTRVAQIKDALLEHHSLSERVLAEQVHIAAQQLPFILGTVSIAASLWAYMIWNEVARINIIAWLILVGGMHVLLGAFYLWYRRRAPYEAGAEIWARRMVIMAFWHGCVLGAGGVLLFTPASLTYQFMEMALLFAWTAGAAVSLASYRPAFYAIALPILLPFLIRLAMETDLIHTLSVCGMLLFSVSLAYGYHHLSKTLLASLVLRFENIALVKELVVKNEQAEQANIAKSRFLSAASHDLRQPLHALSLFVGELKEHSNSSKNERIIEKIQASLDAMTNLFNALLDISKLDAGIISPNIKDFPVNDILAEIELEFFPQAQAKGLRFSVMPCKAMVRSDPTLLSSIVRNFVSNAIRYTDRGGIVLGCRRRGERVAIEVWDTGMGVPSEEQQNIFQEFYQLKNPERDRSKGLGLGLAVVQRTAKLLGHGISVASRPAMGSRFSVDVPKIGDALTNLGVVKRQPPLRTSLENISIVVIDDEQTVREAMQGLLAEWRCHALIVASAEEALERLIAWPHSPQIIIADYRLRAGKTGVEAIRQIQSCLPAAIPAIIVTGDTGPERLAEVSHRGHVLMHKPVQPDKLRETLRQLTAERDQPDVSSPT